MFFHQLQLLTANRPPVKAAVIGAGKFGSGIVRHARYVPALQVCALCDSDLAAAQRAYTDAGVPQERIVIADSSTQAREALQAGQFLITQDPTQLFGLDYEVLVEATGVPEAGALHAREAIAHGKHVAMVTKEADAAVGPMPKRLADRAGVVYTAVEGDQHGMLTGLVIWARSLGMEVLCGAKALDGELLFDPEGACLQVKRKTIYLDSEVVGDFVPRDQSKTVAQFAEMRQKLLGPIAGAKPWDIVELVIAANSTGLIPDIPQLHCPTAYTSEIPELLCPREFGGLLGGTGRIEAVQILRNKHEASLGGGVMVIVRVEGSAMREIVTGKGMICHRTGDTAMLMRPHHLLGVEAIGSVLTAALLRLPTGALEYCPRYDAVYRTTKALPAGSTVGHDHSPELTAEIHPASRLAPGERLPAGLARGRRLTRDLPAGTLLTCDMVERPTTSALWTLREQMESEFAIA